MGKPLIMGRRTHESIGQPLPGRTNIVVTREPERSCAGCLMVASLAEALEITENTPERMVIGGRALYAVALPIAQRFYLTEVHAELAGDTYFPAYVRQEWEERERVDLPADAQNAFPYSFVLLERRRA
jgi:dihydrofolate reductase